MKKCKKEKKVTEGAIKRLATRISPATLKHLVCVAKADHLGRGPFVDPKEPEKSFMPIDYPAGEWLLRKASELGVYETKPQPVLFGRDLIALGFKPGPKFGEVIRLADEMHVRGFARDEVLALIGSHRDLSLDEVIQILGSREK